MPRNEKHGNLTDPAYCMSEAKKLLIPVDSDNWDEIKDDAPALNVLQAAITHLVYLDTEQSDFQQQVMEIVFTAYLMGKTAEERAAGPIPEAFLEAIEGLDLTGLAG